MKGRQKALEHRLWLLWRAEAFQRTKRLRHFDRYVREVRPRKAGIQTAEEVLEIMQDIQAAGIPVSIKRVKAPDQGD